jgi:hypothetical protein
MPYVSYGRDKATHEPRSETIASATSTDDAIAQATSMGIEVDLVEEVTTPPPAVSPNTSGLRAGNAPPDRGKLKTANVVGIMFGVLWAAIVLPFGWYWLFPEAKGTFSFGQLLLAVLPAPVFCAIGNAIGKKLGMWALAVGGIVAAIVIAWFYSPSLFRRGQGSWAEFTSDQGGFSVLMPGTPKESQETQSVLFFSLTMHMLKARIPGGPEECVVSYADYSESMMNWMPTNPNELLDHSCRGMEAGGKGKLIDIRPIALAGYPGREVTCRRDQGGETWFVRARLYLVDRRLYHLAFASRQQDRIAAKDIDEFLASFKLTSKSAKKGHAE